MFLINTMDDLEFVSMYLVSTMETWFGAYQGLSDA